MSGSVLAAIAGMTLATLLCRVGGYLLFRATTPPPLVHSMLSYVPGALFVAYVVPALASGGGPAWIGATVTVLLMLVTRDMGMAVLGGTLGTWLPWAWMRGAFW